MFSKVFDRNEVEYHETVNQEHLKQSRGRMLWSQLHKRAYNHNGTNDSEFIADFGKQIPRFLAGCPCNEFWNKWIQDNPPRYGIDEYFEWTVRTHNAVNAKLGKPAMSFEDARKNMQ